MTFVPLLAVGSRPTRAARIQCRAIIVRGITHLGEDFGLPRLVYILLEIGSWRKRHQIVWFPPGIFTAQYYAHLIYILRTIRKFNFRRTVILIGSCEEFFFMEIGYVCITSCIPIRA